MASLITNQQVFTASETALNVNKSQKPYDTILCRSVMCAEVMTIHLLSLAMLHKGLFITKDSITNGE